MAVRNISFKYLQLVSDDEMGFALPLRTVGCAAPAMGIGPGLQMLVEGKVIETQIDATVGTQVKFHCERKDIVRYELLT